MTTTTMTTTTKSTHRPLASLKLANKVPALITQAENIVQQHKKRNAIVTVSQDGA